MSNPRPYEVREVSGSRVTRYAKAMNATSRANAVSMVSFVPEDELELVDGGAAECAPAGAYVARYSTPAGRQFLVWEAEAEPMVRGPFVPLNAYA